MINLLPPEKKEKVANEVKERIALTLMFFLVIFLSLLSVTAYGLKHHSLNILESEKQAFSQKKKQYLSVIDKKENIKKVNSLASEINDFKEDRTDLIELFAEIDSAIPENGELDEIEYQRKKNDNNKMINEIILTGNLSKWKDLIELESNLKEKFTEVNFSSESWTQTEDINFMVKFINNE